MTVFKPGMDKIRFAVDYVRGQVTEEDGVAMIIWNTAYPSEGGELNNKVTLEGFTAKKRRERF